MRLALLVIGAILVVIASAILLANIGYSYTLVNAWLLWAIIGTIYGIGAVLVFYALLAPSAPKTAPK